MAAQASSASAAPAVASSGPRWRQCGGELDSLNQMCCRSRGRSRGQPAAAPMRRVGEGPRARRGEVAAAAKFFALQNA